MEFPLLPDLAGRLPMDAAEPHIIQTDYRPFDELYAEVQEEPTPADNVEQRYRVLMSWVGDLMDRGINIDPIYPMKLGRRLEQLVETGQNTEAGPIIDEIVMKIFQFDNRIGG